MITLYKTYRFSGGKPPYNVLVIPSDSKIKLDPVKYTTDEYLELTFNLQDINTNGTVKLQVTDANGCENEFISDIVNPCQSNIAAEIKFLPANSFIVDVPNRLNYKYNWFASNGVKLEVTDYLAVVVDNVGITDYTVYCIISDNFGCETQLSYNYQGCKPRFDTFNVQGQCLKEDIIINGVVYNANSYSYSADINLAINTIVPCDGCVPDWTTLSVSPSSTNVKVLYSTVDVDGVAQKTGVIKIVAPQGNKSYTVLYDVHDSCGNIYQGEFTYNSTTCVSNSNCFSIVPLSPIQVKCSDIDINADPKYTLTTPILYTSLPGAKQPDWSTFKFVLPSSNGVPLTGYSLASDTHMITPLGEVFFNANGTLTYEVNLVIANPITETIPWLVCDSTGTCCSNVVLQAFVHACDPNPTATDFTVCLNCGNSPLQVDMTSHIDLKGNSLLDFVITNISNNALTVTPDIPNKKLILSVGYVTGTITFTYQVKTSNNLLSDPKTVTVTVNCAGASQTVAYC